MSVLLAAAAQARQRRTAARSRPSSRWRATLRSSSRSPKRSSERDTVTEWLERAGGIDGAMAELSQALGIDAGGHDRERRRRDLFDGPHLADVANGPARHRDPGKAQDRPRSEQCERLTSAAQATGSERIAALSPVFCTGRRLARANVVTQAHRATSIRTSAQRLLDEQKRVCALLERRPRRHHPHPHRRAADARQRGHRALSRREGSARPARLRRPDRQDPRPAHPRERGLGALQARPRHRSPPDRRGAGYEPGAMGHHRAAGRRVRRRRRRARRAAALDLRGRRRQAVDLLVPGRRPARIPRQAASASSAPSRPPRSNGATSAWPIRSARTTAC